MFLLIVKINEAWSILFFCETKKDLKSLLWLLEALTSLVDVPFRTASFCKSWRCVDRLFIVFLSLWSITKITLSKQIFYMFFFFSTLTFYLLFVKWVSIRRTQNGRFAKAQLKYKRRLIATVKELFRSVINNKLF